MVGEMIRAARQIRGLSQDELASKLGINRATLSKYEGNIIEPSSSMLILISKSLNVPVSFLFGESSTQVLSFDFQLMILSTVQERISFLLSTADSADLFEQFGTYQIGDIYRDVFYPKLPVSVSRLKEIADELGVTIEYLLGVIEDPDDTVESIEDRQLLWKAIDALSALNNSGQLKAVERIEELTEISRYKKEKPPQAET